MKYRCHFDEGGATVDVEMIGRLVEHDHMGARQGRETEQKPRTLAARQPSRRRVSLGTGKPHGAGARPHLRLRLLGQETAQVVIGAVVGRKLVELVLGEIRDLELVGARDPSRHRGEPAGQELHQRGFTVAVGAQKRNAVVGVDAQIEAPQRGLPGRSRPRRRRAR